MSTRIRNLLLTTSALLALGTVPGAAGPDGGTVVGGSATVSGAGTSAVIVNQSSSRAIINWTTFNLGAGESATFNQPNSSSVVLNRVTGGLGASTIDGVLNANGRVFIINRDGILFGKNATINTASFLATTHDIHNDDFMAGRMNFTIPGRPDASIVNLGRITAQTGGFAALVAPGVRNSGTISANLGTVALASGNMFTLDMYGDHLIQLGVNDAIAAQVIDVATGKPLKSLVGNEGTLKANGGRVELTAVAARAVVDSVINNTGVIEANSVGTRNGKIVLGAATAATKGTGAPKQTVKVSGRISASGKTKGSNGGTIVITGEDIQFANAVIDASGSAGGGRVMVGGDWAGGNPDKSLVNNTSATLESYAIDHASTVTMDAGSRIDASARDSGNGGKVILWSDVATTFAGTILARGGAAGGDGGFVETSGHQLAFAGAVDTSAPKGKTGTLLLDPLDYYIVEAGDDSVKPAGASVITNTALEGQLNLNSVVIATNNDSSEVTQHGDIFVNGSVNWTGNNSLTLNAYRDINFASGVTISNVGAGNLTLRADSTGTGSGTVTFESFCDCTFPPAPGAVDFSQSSGKVAIFYNPESYDSPTDYSQWVTTGGSGKLIAYMLVNDAQNLQNISENLGGTYALGRNIDATGTAKWNSGEGFVPIGPIGGGGFTGSLDGQGYAIDGLTIAPTTRQDTDIGLFGTIYGSVSNLNLTNVSVTASPNLNNQFVGGLAGQNSGTITNVTVAGTINGAPVAEGALTGVIAGGLVGQNGVFGPEGGALAGTISNSSANVTVVVGDGCSGDCIGGLNIAGGLVGSNAAGSSITGSHATGTVSGGDRTLLGGLVGQNGVSIPQIEGPSIDSPGTITSSWADVAVTGTGSSSIGGLVGQNWHGSTITDSQAFGAVISSAAGFEGIRFADAGGLVGQNWGMITSTTTPALTSVCAAGASFSCATGQVTLNENGDAGGLVGFNQGTVDKSFATGNVIGNNGLLHDETIIGGLVGNNEGTIATSFATGDVGTADGASIQAGGLAGFNNGMISNSFSNGAVRGGIGSMLGGLVGYNDGSIADSYHTTGGVFGTEAVIVGGLVGFNDAGGTITTSHAAVPVGNSSNGFIGGFVGFNAGDITLSYAAGDVSGGDGAWLGGFVGLNAGSINQAYARGAVTGGAASFVGGFVGINVPFSDGETTTSGQITQSYALGPTTGGAGSYTASFAALNFGSFDQVYGVGLVTGSAGSTTGGLVASNSANFIAPDVGSDGPTFVIAPGTVTNSYWDRQTTGQETSAGGNAVDTAVLAGAVPANFDTAIWSHGSYPHLTNLGPQNTIPGPPVLPPLDQPLSDQPHDSQSLVLNQLTDTLTLTTLASTDPLVIPPPPPPPPPAQTQQQQQSADAPTDRFPGQIDAGPGRLFVLPLNETRIVSDEVVLQLPCNVSQQALAEVIRTNRLSVVGSQCLGTSGLAVYRMHIGSGQTIATVIRAMVAHRIVAVAQANYTFALMQEPQSANEEPTPAGQTEPDLSGRSREGDAAQYVLDKLHLAQVHRAVTGSNIRIAVIDSEIDATHPDIKDNIVARYDATGAEDKPHPHGTGMAGAIVSHTRLMGIAPGAQIAAVHAFGSGVSAESTTYNILKGLDWSANNGVRVVNMSFAGPRDPSLERAIKAAHDKGIVLVGAAGNAGPRSPPLYPAADPNVIAVTATDIDDKLFRGANRGRYITIAAPGVDILVPAPASAYQMTTGTSVATAHISGVVALMLQRNPQLKPEDVRKILMASAKRLGPNTEFGAGLVDPIKALQLAAPRSAGR